MTFLSCVINVARGYHAPLAVSGNQSSDDNRHVNRAVIALRAIAGHGNPALRFRREDFA